MSTLILVALICLIVGIAAGSLLTKTLHPQEKLRRELEEELARVRNEHKSYQQEVTAHFARTADLVGNLTQNFHAVHDQLANSAMELATPEVSRKLVEAAAPRSGNRNQGTTITSVSPEPPRDYAPRVPGGILSEHYGLEQDLASRTARAQHAAATGDESSTEPRERQPEEEDPTLKVG